MLNLSKNQQKLHLSGMCTLQIIDLYDMFKIICTQPFKINISKILETVKK